MVNMNKLKKLLELVVLAGYLKNEKPVSLLIVGRPESGKTSLTNTIITNKGVLEVTDLSPYGITKMIIPEIERGNDIKHLVIPDFLVVLSKSKVNSDRMISFLNSMTEEGIANIGTYLNKGIEFKSNEKIKKSKVRCGIITSMTAEMFESKYVRMNNFGFLSRVLIIKYEYSDSYLTEVFKKVRDNQNLHLEETNVNIPTDLIEVKPESDDIHLLLQTYARNKISSDNVNAYGIRLYEVLQSLLKVIAYKNGHTEITMEDYKELMEFDTLINYTKKSKNVAVIDG